MWRRTLSIIVHRSKLALVARLEVVLYSISESIFEEEISGRVETDARGRARIEETMTSSIRRLFQVRSLLQISY